MQIRDPIKAVRKAMSFSLILVAYLAVQRIIEARIMPIEKIVSAISR